MSTRGLQTLLAATVTDRGRKALLLERSPAAYAGFEFSPPELAGLLSIQAQTLEEFAAQAHRLFYGEELCWDGAAPIYERLRPLQDLDCA